jgi:hypothetical protein
VAVAFVSSSSGAQAHTEISDERPRFDPVRVFLGPVPGWKGPVLAARSGGGAEGAALPADAKAYVGEKVDAAEGASANGAEPNAPAVLKRAVRTPHLAHGPKARLKLVRHAALEAKSPKKPAVAKAAAVAVGADAKGQNAKALKKDVKSGTGQ